MLLVGDAGGMVNPFNGEGIAYAMESAAIAARCAAAVAGPPRRRPRRRRWRATRRQLRQALGGYYRIGNLFSRLIGNPTMMGLATRHGLPRRTLMEFLLKLLANLYDPKDGATSDRRDHRDDAPRPERLAVKKEVRLAWLRPGGCRDLGSRHRSELPVDAGGRTETIRPRRWG